MTYVEVRKDYNTLDLDFGSAYDFTGVFEGDGNISDNLLGNPSKANAKRIMIDVIKHGFSSGDSWKTDEGNYLISENDILQIIHDKYCT